MWFLFPPLCVGIFQVFLIQVAILLDLFLVGFLWVVLLFFFFKYETKVINEGVKLIWIFWQDHTVSIHEINFVSLIRAFIFFSEGRLNNFVATPTELLFPFAPTMIIVMVDLVWLDNIKTLS